MTYPQNFTSFEITEDQVAWILLRSYGTQYVYRISDNGTVLQTIWFGYLNLRFGTNYAFLGVLSTTDFMFVQDLSLYNGNMSVGPLTAIDYSIARISIDLSVKWVAII